MAKQYKTLEKSNDYDHDKAEEYAEAVMELRALNDRCAYLHELIEAHEELQDSIWTTVVQRGVPRPAREPRSYGNRPGPRI